MSDPSHGQWGRSFSKLRPRAARVQPAPGQSVVEGLKRGGAAWLAWLEVRSMSRDRGYPGCCSGMGYTEARGDGERIFPTGNGAWERGAGGEERGAGSVGGFRGVASGSLTPRVQMRPGGAVGYGRGRVRFRAMGSNLDIQRCDRAWPLAGSAATPSGVDGFMGFGFRWCRFAQPPATGCHPSGMDGRCGRGRPRSRRACRRPRRGTPGSLGKERSPHERFVPVRNGVGVRRIPGPTSRPFLDQRPERVAQVRRMGQGLPLAQARRGHRAHVLARRQRLRHPARQQSVLRA